MERILMISSDKALASGVKGAFFNTLTGFHKFWERIDIICPYVKKPVYYNVFGNVFFHPLSKGKLLAPIFILKKGIEICSREKPSLIIAHSYGPQLMAIGGWLLSKKTGIPLVVEVHHVEGYPIALNFKDYIYRLISFNFLRFMANRALAFRIVNKMETFSLLVSLGVSENKILTLYSMYIDFNIFYPQPINKIYDFIFVGRLVSNKGLPLLLNAFSLVSMEFPETKLLIVGRGPLQKWLRKKIQRQTNIKHIEFLLSLNDIAKTYNQSKIVICSSAAEGGPRFVVEAMACGLPAISTPVGLMREIIKNGENGFLLSGWTTQEMANAMIDLLKSEDLYKRCSLGAKNTANFFNYDKVISDYALSYKNLIQQ